MAHDVGAGEFGEVNVVDAVEDPHGRAQAGVGAAGQVDLRDIARHNYFRVEPQPGEKHLHLFAGGVLSLVQDDERIIEGVVGEQEILGDVKRVLGSDLNTHCFLGPRRLNAVNETHWTPTARGVVFRCLASQPEWSKALRQADVEDVRVGSVMYLSTTREAGFASFRLPSALIGDATERLHQEHDVIPQSI